MATRARVCYQGGASFNVFSAHGSNPTRDCKVCGKGIQKVYDKSVKGYVYSLSGGPSSKLQLPKDETKIGLQLLQPFLVFQLFVPAGQPMSLELRITDTTNTRRKMYISTSFSDIKSTPLHCQIPVALVARNKWLSLSIHVPDLFYHCFQGMNFRSVDVIVLGPVCKLRKIFTMRDRPVELGSMCGTMSEESLPQEHMFAIGVDTDLQILDMATLKMSITGLTIDPSTYGTRRLDTIVSGRKPQTKLEPQQVHVAFGSRMPLPLSTVQINTNLPGDKTSHMIRVFPKEQNIRKSHAQGEPTMSIQDQKRAHVKAEALQILLKRANTMKNNPELDRPKKESSDMRSSVAKSTKGDGIPKGIAALTSLSMEEFDAIHPIQLVKFGQVEDIVSTTSIMTGASIIENVCDDVLTKIALETNKVTPKEETNTKRECATTGLGKYTRRDSHMESVRGKEYQQSKYVDSPPESPPCGWTSCLDHFANEEKPFNKCVFEGLSLFGKMDELEDDLGQRRPNPRTTTNTTSTSSSMHSFHDVHRERTGLGRDPEYTGMKDPLSEKFVEEVPIVRSVENFNTFAEERPRPVGVVHEKFDLGNDENFVFHYSEFATMSEDELTVGGQSWSSSSSHQPHDNRDCFEAKCLGGDGAFGSHENSWTLKDKDDHNGFQSPNYIPQFAVHSGRDRNPFDLGSDLDHHIEADVSPTIPRPKSKRSIRDARLSLGTNQFEDHEKLASSSSWQSLKDHSIFPFSLKSEPYVAKQTQDSLVHKGHVPHNERPEEDLDLLYDPTLDCYYDPKTNRYYELK